MEPVDTENDESDFIRIREAPEQSIDKNLAQNIVYSQSSSTSSQGPLDDQDSDGDAEKFIYFKKRGQNMNIKIDSPDELSDQGEEENLDQ